MRFDEYDFAKPFISENEEVLWRGKPAKGLFITWNDVYMLLFGCLWCGLVVKAMVDALGNEREIFQIVMLASMLCLGFGVSVGRVIYSKLIARQTAYVITSKKIIRKRGSKIDTLENDNRPEMRVVVRKNGIGSIRFGYAVSRRGRYGGVTINSSSSNPGVFSIDNITDVAKVQEILYR